MAVLTMTMAAARKVEELAARESQDGCGLRVKVIGGGCSGLQYQLSFSNQADEWDQISDHHGVQLMVDAKSAVYLAGSTVDYVDDLNGAGFKIQNPNASSTCGCGESFGV